MKRDDTEELRQRIAERLTNGQTIASIARDIGCSRTTVYRVQTLLSDPAATLTDSRSHNRGFSLEYVDRVRDAVLAYRDSHPAMGPRMMFSVFERDPASAGLTSAEVPSPATIGRMIQAAGLARKPIGPRDNRKYPDAKPTEPGTLTIDGWGPWNIRASKVYLVTFQDRFTRMLGAIPTVGGRTSDRNRGLKAGHYSAAIQAAQAHLLPGTQLQRVYCDNGIGLTPAGLATTQATRAALALGASMTFIPPAQPWRNGRLERAHWSMESEYWREQRPSTIDEAMSGLTDYINWFNTDRPHSALRYQAPADSYPYEPFGDLKMLRPSEHLPIQTGLVELVRMVLNRGEVELWGGFYTRVSPLLAGQYVRVQIPLPGPQAGRIVYTQRGGEQLTVAAFTHILDAGEPNNAGLSPVQSLELIDFADDVVPVNQHLDIEREANRRARVSKRSWSPPGAAKDLGDQLDHGVGGRSASVALSDGPER